MTTFDPYHKWLGIPPDQQPADHYRLLSIGRFESDIEVIESAADRQMAYIQQCATGPYTEESQLLLNELAAARVCLLNSNSKSEYDISLRKQRRMKQASSQSREASSKSYDLTSPASTSRQRETPNRQSSRSRPSSQLSRPSKKQVVIIASVLFVILAVSVAIGIWNETQEPNRNPNRPDNRGLAGIRINPRDVRRPFPDRRNGVNRAEADRGKRVQVQPNVVNPPARNANNQEQPQRPVLPILWNMEPDPLREPIEYAKDGISIALEAPFGGVTYPPTPSPFIAVGRIPLEMEIWDLRTVHRSGLVKLWSRDWSLSPDGEHLIIQARNSIGLQKPVELWSIPKGSRVWELTIPTPAGARRFLSFVSPTRVIVCDSGSDLMRIVTIDVPSGQIDKQIETSLEFRDAASVHGLSAGGRYFAGFDREDRSIRIIDLSTGALAGHVAVPIPVNYRGSFGCGGIGFSNDGTQFSALIKLGAEIKILSWNIADGKISEQLHLDRSVSSRLWRTTGKPHLHLQFMQSGWLLNGTSLVQRGTGRALAELPRPINVRHSTNRVISGSRVLMIDDDTSRLNSIFISPEGVAQQETTELATVGPPPVVPDNANDVNQPRDEFEKQCHTYVQQTYADVLTADQDKLGSSLRWSPLLKKPMIGLRWGFAAQYGTNAPKGSVVKAQPLTVALERSLSTLTAGVSNVIIGQLKLKSSRRLLGRWPAAKNSRADAPMTLGAGSRKEILAAARRVGLDVIVIASFNITVRSVFRETRMTIQVIDVESGKHLFQSGVLEARPLRTPSPADAESIAIASQLWIDFNLKLKLIDDDLKRSDISSRVLALGTITQPTNPTVFLTEVRFYQDRQLVSAKEAVELYSKVLTREDAEILANGLFAERRAMLKRVLPKLIDPDLDESKPASK